MHRYSPVRAQRSKGVKIKHILRICFLIAVCCWLMFQIKSSHCKRRDFKSVDSKILSRTNGVDEVLKLGRKDLHSKETETLEEEDDDDDDEEHEIEEEKDDEIDENEQYKFDYEEDTVIESEEKDGQSRTEHEEHYKADDASSAVTHEHDDQTLDNSKFLETGNSEHENHVHNRAKIQEMGFESANVSSVHGQNDSDSTQVVEKLATSLKSTNMSAVVESQTLLATKENNVGSFITEDETEDSDEVQHDTIDSTDFIRLEDLDAFDSSEDTVAE
ncbi:hypothetical protein E3N88_43044 [Mikania micrantha]|uniref:Uncharacterized protein n=1 Tax=Mikania micrantha TaxID=192012 RepID=A0A5N6LGV8_9ASTR|nr:hypothetical protein E3N88_43044 [Mikania micrantha]